MIDSIRDEMARGTAQVQFLGEGVTALCGLYPEVERLVTAAGKTLDGCLEAIKKAAKGGVADPVRSTEAICKYYGLDFKDYRRLAAEVNLALCGGAQAHAAEQGTEEAPQVVDAAPTHDHAGFDLDALLEGL